MKEKNTFTIKESSEILSVKYERLLRLIRKGIIPCIKLNEKLFMSQQDIDICKDIIEKGLFYSDIREIKNKLNDNKDQKKEDQLLIKITNKNNKIINLKSEYYNSKTDFVTKSILSHIPKKDNLSNDFFSKMTKKYKEDNKSKEDIINLIFEYYRYNGFPFYDLNETKLIKEIEKIANINSDSLILENDVLKINNNGLLLCSYWHKHVFSMTGSSLLRSPMQTFLDDDRLRDCIKRWLDLGMVCNESGMRKILKTRNGTRSTSLFRPSVAKFIFDKYVPINGMVLDPCSGFGGRLLGCIASNKNIFYHGIDVNGEVCSSNSRIAGFYSDQIDIFGRRKYMFNFRTDVGRAEDCISYCQEKLYDLVFTSPPYFNLETYNNSVNQSHIFYNKYEDWLSYFIFKIIKDSQRILKDSGFLVLNIKNIKNYNISDDVVSFCLKNGFCLYKTHHMMLANNEFNRNIGKNNYHTEPIFVFSKEMK